MLLNIPHQNRALCENEGDIVIFIEMGLVHQEYVSQLLKSLSYVFFITLRNMHYWCYNSWSLCSCKRTGRMKKTIEWEY